MPTIIKRSKALSVNPLKVSQTVGAALAFLGFNRSIPMLHGAQGCTAFGKVFFVLHYREPIPLQTTAMDQVSTVMGSEDSVVEGLKTIAEKNSPSIIGVPSTGLTETQGSDLGMALNQFRQQHPEFDHIPVVPVSTPDYTGCLETGFAKAVEQVIKVAVPTAEESGTKPGTNSRQINVLVGSSLTPGDLEELKEIVEAFGMQPVVIPDISDSLGYLGEGDFSPLTIGGTDVSQLATLGDASATIVIGRSMFKAADELANRTNVPDHRFDHLMGLDAVDALVDTLHRITGESVPPKLERQRAQLQDAMLDSHFMLGMSRFAIAADPDLLVALDQMLAGVGAKTVAAVTPVNVPILQDMVSDSVKIGDLEDVEKIAAVEEAEVLITNAHGVQSAERLGIPLLRAGFPQYDQLGGQHKVWIGYRGSRQTLFDLANIMLSLEKGEIHPYRSIYSQKVPDSNSCVEALH